MATDNTNSGPCAECGELISQAATTCPHCDHNAIKTAYAGPLFLLVLGGVLTVFVVTAVIGIPLMLAGLAWAGWIWWAKDVTPIDET